MIRIGEHLSKLSVRLTFEEREAVEYMAKLRGQTLSEGIRSALNAYSSQPAPPAKLPARRERPGGQVDHFR